MYQVILGSDRALAKQALDRVLAAIDPTGLDTDRIDAAGHSFDAIFAAVTAAPFFGSRRVIVLSGMLGQSTAKPGRGSKGKSESDLSRLVSSVPDSTVLIFYDPEIGELGAAVKKHLGSGIEVSINDAPRGNALVELCVKNATDQGSTLDHATAQKLLNQLFPEHWRQAAQNRAFDKPPSVEQLRSEIGKLALAAYPGPITNGLIDDLVPQRTEERVFPLLDAVIGGNQRGALAEIEKAGRTGEDPSRTLNQLYQQIELSAGAIASGRPGDALQAGRSLGVTNAYRMTRVTEGAQRARIHPARQLRLALETDRKMKTGRLRTPDDALTDLVIRGTASTENR